MHVADLEPLGLHCRPVGRPRVCDPNVAGCEGALHNVLVRPDEPDYVLLGREQFLRSLQLGGGLLPGILDSQVVAGNDEHVEVVPPGDLARVALVQQEAPRELLGLHLVGSVEERVEAPVGRDPVLLALVLAGFDHVRVEVLEVGDQLRIPRLDEATLREVPDVADIRAHDVRLEAGGHLGQRVRLAGHQGELRLLTRVLLHVLREHRLAAVVPVPGPVKHLQAPALRSQPLKRRPGGRGPAREEPCSTRDRRELEYVLAAEPPLHPIHAVTHLDLPPFELASLRATPPRSSSWVD